MFGRRVAGRVLSFGVSGLLRQSNLILWDRETESWWQQGTLTAIVGELAGRRLEPLPAQVIPWRDFRDAYPEGKVLSPRSLETYARAGVYGTNPYEFYDTSARPFLYEGEIDPRLPATERVVGLVDEEGPIAYPFSALARVRVLYTVARGREVVLLFRPDTRSPLDTPRIAAGRRVGAAGVFLPEVGGQRLTLEPAEGGRFRDRETGSLWTVFGTAVAGPLKGQRLTPVFHTQAFWFYWSALHPNTRIWIPPR